MTNDFGEFSINIPNGLAKDVDNIVAIKAATGNLSQESKTMALAEGRLDMYSGEDGLIVPLMSIGAKGVISVLSNTCLKTMF